MKKFFKEHTAETIITIAGILLTVYEQFFSNNANEGLAILIPTITVISDIIILAIKRLENSVLEIIKQTISSFGQISKLYILFSNVPSKWEEEAKKNLNKIYNSFEAMSNGTRNDFDKNDLIEYQETMLLSAQKSVYAIHRSDNITSLERWDPDKTTKDFTKILIEANRNIKANVIKQRIFIVDDESLSEDYLNTLHKTLYEQKNTLNFDAKILRKKVLEAHSKPIPEDILICDEEEVFTVHFSDNIVSGTAIITQQVVKDEIKKFKEYWKIAEYLK